MGRKWHKHSDDNILWEVILIFMNAVSSERIISNLVFFLAETKLSLHGKGGFISWAKILQLTQNVVH